MTELTHKDRGCKPCEQEHTHTGDHGKDGAPPTHRRSWERRCTPNKAPPIPG